MSYLYLKFFIGYLTHVTAAILQLCMNINFWSFLKAFPPGFFSNSTNGNYIFSVLRQKKKNPLFLDSILLYPHIKFISKFYCFSLPSKYWQIPKSEKFPDAFTVQGQGSIPGLRELRSHKPHSMAKKKKKNLSNSNHFSQLLLLSPLSYLISIAVMPPYWFPCYCPMLSTHYSQGSMQAMCHAVLSCFSCVQLFVTLWTIAHQAPLSVGFSRQEYWNGLPCPPPRDLPNPGIEPTSFTSPALAGGFFTTSTTWVGSPM